MPEIIIKYNDSKILQIMKDLSEYLNFSISDLNAEDTKSFVPADESAEIEELRKMFSGKGLSAKKLRKSAWNRT
jgi:hypothetical protein